MTALTWATAKTLIGNVMGESDSTFLDDVGVWLDQAQRDINRAHPWPSMMARGWIVTAEAYTTGTVSITTNTTALTGTLTVFPSDVVTALYRWAPSYSDPWHYIATRVGDTSLTLAEAYRGATLTDAEYKLYRVDYSLPSDCETVEKIRLHDHNDGEIVTMTLVTPEQFARWSELPESEDRPIAYFDELPPLSTGVKQIRVGPCAPDDTYRMEVLYRKATTDGSASLPQDLEDLWVLRAKAYAYERDHWQKYLQSMQMYEAMLEDKWRKTRLHTDEHFFYGQERVHGASDDDYPVNLDLNSLEI